MRLLIQLKLTQITIMKKEKETISKGIEAVGNYVSPSIEVIDVEVEIGFATSFTGENEVYQQVQGNW